jgi:hypothetical protein
MEKIINNSEYGAKRRKARGVAIAPRAKGFA